ncbi:helix-turn-helix domain-containing protein [Streptomyces sp. NPDC016469]|uniref:TetR/AcrR family transcriptional regulator n=1 Tax=Streptomyces sp. NPDC016469 TaxID=3157191 RepID=UPI0033D90F03
MTDPAPEAPRRLSKGERTRARVLDSATELFARSGFLAVSLRDIAAHAGLTHAGVLHHFPGKEALLLDVLSRRDELDARRLFPGMLAPGDPEPEPAERLRLLLDVVTRNARTPGLVALYAKLSTEASDPEHPAHLYFVRRYQVLRREMTGLLAELFAAAGVREDPAAAAQQLLALLDGLQTQWLLEPDAVDMAEQVRAFLRRYGVAAEEGG